MYDNLLAELDDMINTLVLAREYRDSAKFHTVYLLLLHKIAFQDMSDKLETVFEISEMLFNLLEQHNKRP
jgi:hypothetical protein